MNPADLAGVPMRLDLLVELLAGLLVEATLAGSAAVALVLALRRPLRRAFGATVAYAAWALVPAAVLAVSLPAATVAVAPAPVAMLVTASVAPLATVPVAAPLDVAPWLLAAWLVGALVMALRLVRQQRAFRRGLGRLRFRADGLQQAQSVAGLPAALGLLRPAIVVPADFDSRYSREERALMQAHERSHIARGDLQLNALVALLRSVFWFNPLLHYAVRHFRHDQELACDQRVIARHPHGRRAYGEAMFKTQLASQPLPLGCHWAVFDHARTHPLKERIAMLKQPTPTAARWIGGGTVVIVLALGVGFTAWSAQPKREVVGANPLAAEAIAPTTSASGGIVLDNMLATAAPPVPPAPPAPPAPLAGVAPPPPALPLPPAPPAKARMTANVALAPLPPSVGVEVNRTPAPKYPAGAAAQGIAGKVVLEIDIDAAGKPTNVDVVKSEPAGVFDQTTVDAARQWQFEPKTKNGKAVPGRVRVPVEFAPDPPVVPQGAVAPKVGIAPPPADSASGRPPFYSAATRSRRANAALDPAAMVVASKQDGETPPLFVSGKTPVYPVSQLISRKGGSAVIIYTIGTDGRPRDFSVQSTTDERYANHAIIALKAWVFKPATKDGVTVEARARQVFTYKAG